MKYYNLVLSFLLVSLLSTTVLCQWSSDPLQNLVVCDTTGEQVLPKIASISDGGCYISWFDTRAGNYNVYLQRLDPAGNKMFATNGLLISDHASLSWIVDWDMIVDGSDNAVVAFSDVRAGGDFKVYTYLISPSGDFLWGADGVSLSTANDFQPDPRITQTTDGSYIITWPNLSSPSTIAVQKLDVAGNKLYGNDPMYITSGTSEQYTYPVPIPASNGSYIIGFEGTTGTFPGLTVYLYAQKYSSAGAPQWGSSPVTITNAGGFPFYELTNIITDGSGGIVFVWYDDRDFNNLYSTYVQRVDSLGTLLFTSNGVEASTLSGRHHLNPDVVINPTTNEIFAFWIEQNSTQSQAGVYGQKFSATGNRLWTDNGKTFKGMDTNVDLHMSALFQDGNEYVYYLEYIGTGTNNLTKAFSVDTEGNFNWSGNIVTFSTVVSSKSRLASDIFDNGVSVLAWSDSRQDAGGIYAQNIQADGSFGGIVPVELTSFTAALNGNDINLQWQTATETNNRGFEVQRKIKNGIFGSVGFVEGNGTTIETRNYFFTDENVLLGIYSYRLKQIDYDGTYEYSDIVSVEVGIPNEFGLEQNYPNPFNPATTIKYLIPQLSNVVIKVIDILGNEIATLVNEEKPAGSYEVEFNATGLPSGIYFYRLQAGSFVETKKMVLMK